jgi:microsomal epoxide hydrolase
MDPKYHISKPFGYSAFPMELVPVPKAWVETTGNLVFHREHEKVCAFLSLRALSEVESRHWN